MTGKTFGLLISLINNLLNKKSTDKFIFIAPNSFKAHYIINSVMKLSCGDLSCEYFNDFYQLNRLDHINFLACTQNAALSAIANNCLDNCSTDESRRLVIIDSDEFLPENLDSILSSKLNKNQNKLLMTCNDLSSRKNNNIPFAIKQIKSPEVPVSGGFYSCEKAKQIFVHLNDAQKFGIFLTFLRLINIILTFVQDFLGKLLSFVIGIAIKVH